MYDLLTDSTPATNAIPPTDGERLMRFVRHRDEEAFAEVVEAHSALVWSVCWQILRQRQDAEDAFQAAFLILARKAHTIKANDSAAAWLYRVAFRTALRLKERRGRRREEPLGEPSEALATDEQLDAVAASEQTSALMEELHSLPARYQRPLILHYFESKSRAAIAEELGCTTSAIKGRLTRARGMLRSRLARRGVALSTAMAAAGAAFEASAAALPVALPTSTAGLALAFRTKLPLPDGAQVVGSLTQKGIAAMTVATMMKPAAGVLTLVLAGALLAQVNAEEEKSSSLFGEDTSAAVDLLAADEPSSKRISEGRERDVPLEPVRSGSWEAKPVVERSEDRLVAPTQPTRWHDPSTLSSVSARNDVFTFTSSPSAIQMGPPIEPLPAGGKKQLELELEYWKLKALALKQRSEAELEEQVAAIIELDGGDAKEVAKHRRKALEARTNAQSMMSGAESYFARSKQAELEGRLKQVERLEKIEKRLKENSPRPTTGHYSSGSLPANEQQEPRLFLPSEKPTRLDQVHSSIPEGYGIVPFDPKDQKLQPRDLILLYMSNRGRMKFSLDDQGMLSIGRKPDRVKFTGLTIKEAEQKLLPLVQKLMQKDDLQIQIINHGRGEHLYWTQEPFKWPGVLWYDSVVGDQYSSQSAMPSPEVIRKYHLREKADLSGGWLHDPL